ncbi:MAG: LptA/OstA family protein [Elusimicrobiota bacterium]|nr:LptA/OstA family protein [Elusimicrobiota bacterium]
MKNILFFTLLLSCSLPPRSGAADSPKKPREADDFLMGSVVKSDKWKMDRTNDREIFEGNVSFRNPRYMLKADYALYTRPAQTWNMKGSIYLLRRFDDKSHVEMNCDKAVYFETLEEAILERGALPVRIKYSGPDGRILRGRADKTFAENKKGLMTFDGSFSLSTENLDMYSQKALYNNAEGTFLMHDSTPMAVGNRQDYDFAIRSEKIKFFKDSRDIKFYNRVTGWVKDVEVSSASVSAANKGYPRQTDRPAAAKAKP